MRFPLQLARGRESFRKFKTCESGNVAVIASISLVAMLGVGGAALDYSQASSVKTNYQAAMDSAVLAGVTGLSNDSDKAQKAEKFFDQNRPDSGTMKSVSFAYSDDVLKGTVTITVPTRLLKIINIDLIDVTVNSAATAKTERVTMCVMAMNPTRKHTLELNGSVSVIGPACNIYGNSNHPYDVVDPHTTQTFLTGKSVQAIGYGHHYLENVTPPLTFAPELIPDPYASLTIPTASGCDFDKKKISSGSVTLNPGTYCHGLRITGGATVTLNPGTYIIGGDTFDVNGATVEGEGVTIVLADNDADLDFENAVLRLSAPKTGTYQSIVMMAARVDTNDKFVNSTLDLYGVVYMPNAALDWTNNGTPTITAKWQVWIVDGFSWDGNGTIDIPFDIKDADVPYPSKLNVIPKAGTPRLVM